MSTRTVQQAMALHESGNLDAAFTAYSNILKSQPGNLDALMNLSTLHSKRGEYEEAARLLKKLLPLIPKLPYPRFAYGNLLMKLQHYDEALIQFTRAVALDPKNAIYHYNQGVAYDALNRFEEALTSYAHALALEPNHTEALINRANDFYRLGRHQEALDACNQALALDPSIPLAYTTRGNALGGLGKIEEALANYDRAIALAPDSAVAHNNRGNMLKKELVEDALASYENALALDPKYADAHNNRGTALNKLDRFHEAIESCNAALAIEPNSALAYDTRANAYAGLRQFEQALADYDRSLALDPEQINSYWNKTLLTLLLGDYEQGWKLYEHRWRTEFQRDHYRAFDVPLWLGDHSLEGKTILIHPEQGFGDFIQFCRYIPLFEPLGAKVVLETLWPLVPLIEPCLAAPNVTIVEHKTPLPPFDFHCPIMSLPLAFKTRLDTIPNRIPYLWAPPAKKAEWAQKLGPKTKPRIGLVWSGAPIHLNDHNRSMSLELLAPLLALPFEFHSLQKEIRPRDEALIHVLHTHQNELQDFSDTAGLIEAMDLTICVDTSVAHLVGALGQPLWMLLPYAPDYRWLLDREDSVWYPSATLFRQPARGDWPAVIARMQALLSSIFTD